MANDQKTECPYTDCKRMVLEDHDALHGDNGLVGRVVTKGALWVFFMAFGGLILAGVVINYHKVETAFCTSNESKQIIQEQGKRIEVLSKDDAVMKEQYGYILQRLNEIANSLKAKQHEGGY